MNQSDKKNLEFIKNSGISYFLQDSPRIWFENSKSSENLNEIIEDNKKILEIKKVIESIKNHETSLKKSANNLVVYDGTLDAKVMFIGEAPGQEEDKLGTPFVGKAGQLLNKMLAAINIKREEVYITNVVNWRPPNNRTPTDEEILEFLPYLQQQIDIVEPKYIGERPDAINPVLEWLQNQFVDGKLVIVARAFSLKKKVKHFKQIVSASG